MGRRDFQNRGKEREEDWTQNEILVNTEKERRERMESLKCKWREI